MIAKKFVRADVMLTQAVVDGLANTAPDGIVLVVPAANAV